MLGGPEPEPTPPPPVAYVPPSTAILRVYLRPFDDRAASIAQLRELVPLLPRQQLTAQEGTPALDVLTEEMDTTTAKLPRTLQLFAASASTESPRERVFNVPQGGRMYVPALPLTRPSADGNRRLGSSLFRLSDPGGSVLFSGLIAQSIRESETIGTLGHVVDYEIPLASLGRPEVQALLGRDDVSLVRVPLQLKFGASAACTPSADPLLSASESAAITARLASATRDVDLYIVDSGWPQADYAESHRRLFALFDEVRAYYGLPAVQRTIPAYAPAGYDHADKIKAALQPLTALDSGARVRVTYVPLSLAQSSKAVLHELLMLGMLVKTRAHLGGGAHTAVPPSEVADAVTFADKHVGELPPVPGLVMHTDQWILDALNQVATDAARTTGRYYVANYSFVFDAGLVGFSPPSPSRGLYVVAAGNDGADVTNGLVDLAKRGGEDVHFITVMNMDAQGALACNSSFLNAGILGRAGAIGFSGDNGAESQTSFASPRVAWLLALAEASRTTNPQNVWFQELQARLFRARPAPPAGNPFKALGISARTLADIWQ